MLQRHRGWTVEIKREQGVALGERFIGLPLMVLGVWWATLPYAESSPRNRPDPPKTELLPEGR